jgi:hypothetical protein
MRRSSTPFGVMAGWSLMSGIQFVVDANGTRTAVVTDLKKFGDV